jgi:branched-subunit amino acid aminotransferase/4-amino-4-deoxychorismate lyase
MTGDGDERIEIAGEPASPAQLRAAALDHYGHFTAMQVRDGRVKGLDLHLARLNAANAELFGTGLDDALVREYIRHAILASRDASVRVYVREPGSPAAIMVTVRPPAGMPAGPWRLQVVPYQRTAAHIKHLGDFGQAYWRDRAQRHGYDEALLTGPGGIVCEGAITNIGFCRDDEVIWPQAPVLAGITMQLLQAALPAHGLAVRHAEVRVGDVASFEGAFITNARGIAAVSQIDDVTLPVGQPQQATLATLAAVYDAIPTDLI